MLNEKKTELEKILYPFQCVYTNLSRPLCKYSHSKHTVIVRIYNYHTLYVRIYINDTKSFKNAYIQNMYISQRRHATQICVHIYIYIYINANLQDTVRRYIAINLSVQAGWNLIDIKKNQIRIYYFWKCISKQMICANNIRNYIYFMTFLLNNSLTTLSRNLCKQNHFI